MTFISSSPILTKQFKKVNTFKIYTNHIDKIIFLFYFPFITKKKLCIQTKYRYQNERIKSSTRSIQKQKRQKA